MVSPGPSAEEQLPRDPAPGEAPTLRLERRAYSRDARPSGMAELSFALRAVAAGAAALDAIAPNLTTELMLRHFLRPRRKPDSDYRERLPSGAVRLTIPHNELSLTGWEWGTQGPKVLLIHGWEDNSGSMLGFVAPLRSLGFRVTVVDIPGHGLSRGKGTHLVDAGLALANTVRQVGPVTSIIAHSFGAAAVCRMLAAHPIPRPQRMAFIAPMQGLEQHLGVFAEIARLSSPRADRLKARVQRLIDAPIESICSLRALKHCDIPGLVIHDLHDPVIPHNVGARLATEWRDARFVSTANLGHRRILRCPRVLDEILDHHASLGE